MNIVKLLAPTVLQQYWRRVQVAEYEQKNKYTYVPIDCSDRILERFLFLNCTERLLAINKTTDEKGVICTARRLSTNSLKVLAIVGMLESNV